MRIERIEAIPFRLPLRRPIAWGASGSMSSQDHVLVRLYLAGGAQGIAEATPRPTIYGETQASIVHVVTEVFAPLLIGQDGRDRIGCLERLRKVPWNPSARAALDVALHDALARADGLALSSFLGARPQAVRISYMIGLGTVEDAVAEALAVRETTGITAFKIKVGKGGAEDVERVRRLREALGEEAFLFIDANELYDPFEAVRVISAMSAFTIAMAEEPVSIRLGAARRDCAQRLPVPILADDSVVTPLDARRELEAGAIGVMGIKVARSGIQDSFRIAHLAETHALPCWIGSQGVSGIGTLASAHFACAIAHNAPYPADLGTFLRQEADLLSASLPLSNGRLELSGAPGLGAELDEAALERFRQDR